MFSDLKAKPRIISLTKIRGSVNDFITFRTVLHFLNRSCVKEQLTSAAVAARTLPLQNNEKLDFIESSEEEDRMLSRVAFRAGESLLKTFSVTAFHVASSSAIFSWWTEKYELEVLLLQGPPSAPTPSWWGQGPRRRPRPPLRWERSLFLPEFIMRLFSKRYLKII